MSPIERHTFETLVREHHQQVYGAAFQILRDENDARDVTQDVFLSVFEGRQRLDEASDPGPVLRWITAKRALMMLRSARRRRQREDRHAMERTRIDMPEVSELGADETHHLWTLVAELPDELRHAVVLRFREGMTFDAMGASLACSGPTAHDRVRRGLERLRAELPRFGLAGVAVGLEDALSEQATVVVPEGLQSALLGITAKTAVTAGVFSFGTLMSGIVVLAVAASGVWLALSEPAQVEEGLNPSPEVVVSGPGAAREEPGPGVRTSRFVEAARSRLADSPSKPAGAVESGRRGAIGSTFPRAITGSPAVPALSGPTAVITGRVVAREGSALAGILVTAMSVERAGKFPRHVVRDGTDDEGVYRLTVPAPNRDGDSYTLRFAHSDRVTASGPEFSVKSGVTERRDDRVLERCSDDVAGDLTVEVKVVGPDGAAVPKVSVSMWRPIKSEAGVRRSRESTGMTASSGVVALTSSWLGQKVLIVNAGQSGYLGHEESFHVSDAGELRQVVVLRQGLTISGTILDPKGNAVETNLNAWSGTRRAGTWCKDGRFTMVGLAPGEWRLRFGGGIWSIGERDVVAGTSGVRISLKRADDPTDRGDHLAEIHGTLEDGATGESLELDRWGFDVEVRPVPADLVDASTADLFAHFLSPMIAQRESTGQGEASRAFSRIGLPQGTYMIDCRRPGYAPCLQGPIKLEAKEIKSGIILRLERPATAIGRVLGPSGSPVPNAFVFATGNGRISDKTIATRAATIRRTKGRGTQYWGGFVRTDASGRFELPRLPAALDLHVVAIHPTHQPSGRVPMRLRANTETEEITLRLK